MFSIPAWDFQLIVPNPTAGREYGLTGRLVYKEWKGRDDVLETVSAYLQTEKAKTNAKAIGR